MLKRPFNDDDSFDYDSDSTCPTNNSSISHRRLIPFLQNQKARQHQQQQSASSLSSSSGRRSATAPSSTGYCYFTLHTILLLTVGLLISNSHINYEDFAPQYLVTSRHGVNQRQQHRISSSATSSSTTSWTFGVPSLYLNSTLAALATTNYGVDYQQRDSADSEDNNNQNDHTSTLRTNKKNESATTEAALFGLDRVDRSKRLEFVHITKTGGSAIEMGAATSGIQWGVCHYRRIPRMGCNSSADWKWPTDRNFPPHMINKTLCEPWHTPPHWLIPNPHRQVNVANFIVVRDPYQRVLSEFYCPSFGYQSIMTKQQKQEAAANDTMLHQQARNLNAWVLEKLQKDPIYHGHLMPQHYYVFDHITGARLMDHVLKYETLDRDFPRLMKLYGLQVQLPLKNHSQPIMLVVDKSSRLGVANFTLDTIRIINEYFRRDFELFGYRMITHI